MNKLDKYEVAPGLWVGSEIGDIDREIKIQTAKMLNGDKTASAKIYMLQNRREALLMPKRFKAK